MREHRLRASNDDAFSGGAAERSDVRVRSGDRNGLYVRNYE